MESESQERLARNEAFFRQVNERINDVADGFQGEDGYDFFCECADPQCTARITLTAADYEWVRAKPTRFVLARGHTAPEIEQVVEQAATVLGRPMATSLAPGALVTPSSVGPLGACTVGPPV